MSAKKIKSALISVFYKDGLESVIHELDRQGVTIYSTGGTELFIKNLGVTCVPVEDVTGLPGILGGRVKTLHPKIFGGILGRRDDASDQAEMKQYEIPEIDLVIVDLYPFEETVQSTDDENLIIEKIDIGGPSMIRAAAKNHKDLAVIASKDDYAQLLSILQNQDGNTTLEQRRQWAAKAFEIVMNYDIAINNYFNESILQPLKNEKSLRYGENPHQKASFYGEPSELYTQLHGKEISYNNLVDIDAALAILKDFSTDNTIFGIIKHTNVCGLAERKNMLHAWEAALAGDSESAFGGVLFTNKKIDVPTSKAINEQFFEILIASDFEAEALTILQSKKNRILLQLHRLPDYQKQYKSLLNGTLVQDYDQGSTASWDIVTHSEMVDDTLTADLNFANITAKHLKSNAISIVKNRQLIGKGCGQTSRIDALRHAISKAKQFSHSLEGAVMGSDAFFPFDDCVSIADEEGIKAVIQPGGSMRDGDSIRYCEDHKMVMVITGMRHFKH